MGRTTNILDLNNRLEKVEKKNVAQNSYTSLKNKPKINNVTLTGNKSLADIGAAAAADLGELTDLTTTDKSSCVGAINEVDGLVNNVNYVNLTSASTETTAIGLLRDFVNEFLPYVKGNTNIINVKNSNDAPIATVIYTGNTGNPKLYGMGIAISYYFDHAFLIINANGNVNIKQLSEAN